MTREPLNLWTLGRDRRSIAERFGEFDAQHPEVYRLFRDLAVELWEAGHRHGSAEEIVQAIRWRHRINPKCEGGGLKLNDNFRTMYARKLAREDARFAGFFAFRQRRAG